MVGININCKRQDFIRQILDGIKTIETRNSHSLRSYIGKRVGLIQTGKGKAHLMGFATITGEVRYDSEFSFDQAYKSHMVAPDSEFYIKGKKYGYVLSDVVEISPIMVTTKGIIARNIDGITANFDIL